MGFGVLFFLSSGLFLGWSLGANDAANVFGTAVGSRMVRFRTAATACAVFVLVGAVLGGAGAAHTLGRLGAVNTLPGAFTVALAAALATFLMTRAGLPVSTSQAIVGAILGWNFYAGTVTDTGALSKILASWVLCPVLSALIAVLLYQCTRWVIRHSHLHLLRQDALLRAGLMGIGIFGSYSLGANNIANVMGVFLPGNPFHDLQFGAVRITAAQQLFLLGGVAIGVGVLTYSHRVMRTVGSGLMRLSPEAAFVVVAAHSVVLFVFASEGLEAWLSGHGLVTFPLVPVSSSQAVIGAIIGLGILKGGRVIRGRSLAGIGLGWVATPVAAGLFSFFLLFFVDNVFDQRVYRPVEYRIDAAVIDRARQAGVDVERLVSLQGANARNALRLQRRLEREVELPRSTARRLIRWAEVREIFIDPERLREELDRSWLGPERTAALESLKGRRFAHAWQFSAALAEQSPAWSFREDTAAHRLWNRRVQDALDYVVRLFEVTPEDPDGDERPIPRP